MNGCEIPIIHYRFCEIACDSGSRCHIPAQRNFHRVYVAIQCRQRKWPSSMYVVLLIYKTVAQSTVNKFMLWCRLEAQWTLLQNPTRSEPNKRHHLSWRGISCPPPPSAFSASPPPFLPTGADTIAFKLLCGCSRWRSCPTGCRSTALISLQRQRDHFICLRTFLVSGRFRCNAAQRSAFHIPQQAGPTMVCCFADASIRLLCWPFSPQFFFGRGLFAHRKPKHDPPDGVRSGRSTPADVRAGQHPQM